MNTSEDHASLPERLTDAAVDYDAIPTEIRSAPRWLLWNVEPSPSGKKPRKVPYYVNGITRHGELDSPDDVANLATFEMALTRLKNGSFTGLGFALGPDGTGNCWQGVDLDDLPNRPELSHLADDLPGYTETSPSSRGMHAIGYGRPFATLGSNKSGIEAYAKGRFFTVTADRAGNHPPVCIADFVENQLAPLHRVRGNQPTQPEEQPRDSVPPQTITELRSALNFVRSDDRDLWVRLGHALKTLGDVGRALWLDWSQTSDAYDVADAARTWESFKPTRTDYRAVFAAAQSAGWVNPLSNAAQALPPIASRMGAVHAGFEFVQAKDLLSTPTPIQWLVRELFEQGALAQLFGDSGSGKSFVAIDWACCIATGTAWNGKEVDHGAVFYIAGEGHAGIRRRLKAWEQFNGISLSDAPLFVSTAPAALMDVQNASHVARAVEALVAVHGVPKLIIIDTLARNLGNGEENSNADIGLFINNIDVKLRSRFGATVLVVHHSGHVDKERGRGASALRAAMDSEYRLGVADDIRTLSCTKAKESEPPAPMGFKLEQIALEGWMDDEGEFMTSAVLVACTEVSKSKKSRISGANRIALEALQDALAEHGQHSNADLVKEFGRLRAPLRVVHEEVWRQRAYDRGISDGEQDAKQKAFSRSRKALLDLGLISVWKGFYWLGSALAGHRTPSAQCPVASPTEPDRTGHTPIGVSGVRVRTAMAEVERDPEEAALSK